ncbi:hypothetical protein [Rathayibacter rathayi]|uniref:hypothetical protein n=1 Tax=Rathayibacter rathayi TaxID=33887 RepID=UPI0015E1EDC7|nr:hypothetical protein [Rathayibacter rathayi]
MLDSARIAQFLATKRWTIQSDLNYAQVWSEPGQAGAAIARILLRRDTSLDDYGIRLEQAITRISESYGWNLTELVQQISAVRADLFFVRVDQSMRDGTIPLRQATALLDSIDDMIRSAAITANNPHSTGRGRVPAVVNDFLNDDVRMGHTKHGSFIITVAARLDEAATTRGGEDMPALDEPQVPSFTRQVMTTLARTLEVTKLVAEKADRAPSFEAAVDAGMRLPMVKALQEMGSGEGLRSLDMSFEWAPAEALREPVVSKIEMTREVIELLPEIQRRLSHREVPQNVTLTGPVVELKRGDDPSLEEGSGDVVVRADVEGVWRRVSVSLAGADYDVAIVAHRQTLPFTVSGVLEKVGRSWKLVDQVVVDRAFIDFQER